MGEITDIKTYNNIFFRFHFAILDTQVQALIRGEMYLFCLIIIWKLYHIPIFNEWTAVLAVDVSIFARQEKEFAVLYTSTQATAHEYCYDVLSRERELKSITIFLHNQTQLRYNVSHTHTHRDILTHTCTIIWGAKRTSGMADLQPLDKSVRRKCWLNTSHFSLQHWCVCFCRHIIVCVHSH